MLHLVPNKDFVGSPIDAKLFYNKTVLIYLEDSCISATAKVILERTTSSVSKTMSADNERTIAERAAFYYVTLR